MVRSSVSTPKRGRSAATRCASYAQTPAGRTPAVTSLACQSAAMSRGTSRSTSSLPMVRMNPPAAKGTAVAGAGSASIAQRGENRLVTDAGTEQ